LVWLQLLLLFKSKIIYWTKRISRIIIFWYATPCKPVDFHHAALQQKKVVFFIVILISVSSLSPTLEHRTHFSVSWSSLQTVGLLGRMISPSQVLYLNTRKHKHRINTYTYQTSMPCVGFEHTIPASERAKRVHALYYSATVTGSHCHKKLKYSTMKVNVTRFQCLRLKYE
jgi:hypothetical protein